MIQYICAAAKNGLLFDQTRLVAQDPLLVPAGSSIPRVVDERAGAGNFGCINICLPMAGGMF
jgi:hypothetical protein